MGGNPIIRDAADLYPSAEFGCILSRRLTSVDLIYTLGYIYPE